MDEVGRNAYRLAALEPERARFWLSMDCWTRAEASALLFALDPELLSRQAKAHGRRWDCELPEGFPLVQSLLERAEVSGVLVFPANPQKVIGWAMEKQLRLPSEFVPRGVEARGGQWLPRAPARFGDKGDAPMLTNPGAEGDAISDYLFRLEVPADKRSFTVWEALKATSEAMNPEPKPNEPVMVLGIDKAALPADPAGMPGRSTALNDEDWDTLNRIWLRIGEPDFPMPLAQWQPYLDAFNSSPSKPDGWVLSALQRDPKMQCALGRAAALHEHRDVLKRAVNREIVALRIPGMGTKSELGWGGDSDSWLLSRAQMKAFCDLLAIELVDAPAAIPHFITSAWPKVVPPELLALGTDARITYGHRIGRESGRGACSAGDYRAELEATIARQSEGYFTLNEAAQVLADSRSGLDPTGTVKRFRLAHSRGELPIHQGGSRFPLEVGETVRDFVDLLEVAELDAWLRKSAGYGFPPAQAIGFGASGNAATPQNSGVVRHAIKVKGRDVLDPAIELAQSRCRDPKDTAQVWAQLEVLAQEEHAPLLAATSQGVKYMKNGETAYLKRDALDKRLHPEKRKPRR